MSQMAGETYSGDVMPADFYQLLESADCAQHDLLAWADEVDKLSVPPGTGHKSLSLSWH